MKRSIVAIFAGLLWGAAAASAAPVGVDYASIVGGRLEDFERYAPGTTGRPDPAGPVIAPPGSSETGRFDGFGVTTNFAWLASVSAALPFCGPRDKCLETTVSPLYSPVAGTPDPPVITRFDGFDPGVKSFGLRLPGGFESLLVTVTGANSAFTFATAGGGGPKDELAFGFFDREGLVSVVFEGPGRFDDVVTSRLAPVPLPPAGGLLLLGLGGLALLRRRRAPR